MKISRKKREELHRRAKAKIEAIGEDDPVGLESDEMIEVVVGTEVADEQLAAITKHLTEFRGDTEQEEEKNIQEALADLLGKMMKRVSVRTGCQCPFCVAQDVITANSMISLSLILEDATVHGRSSLPTMKLMYSVFSTAELSLDRLKESKAKAIILGPDLPEGLKSLIGSISSVQPQPEGKIVPASSTELVAPHKMIIEVLGRVPKTVSDGQDVMLLSAGHNRIAVVRLIRQLTGVDIRGALNIADSPYPAKICTVELPEEAMAIVYVLKRMGAVASFQKTPI